MTQSAMLTKLGLLLAHGIRSEAEAVYLMAGVRKLLEQQQAKKRYEYLTFHCDWALHAKLDGTTAQEILKQFDAANIHLKTGVELEQLPDLLRMEIERISKLDYFERAQIISDCPLVMAAKNKSATIESVTLQIDMAKAPDSYTGNAMFYQVRWVIKDKNGRTGQICVINSFSIDPERRGKTVPTSAS